MRFGSVYINTKLTCTTVYKLGTALCEVIKEDYTLVLLLFYDRPPSCSFWQLWLTGTKQLAFRVSLLLKYTVLSQKVEYVTTLLQIQNGKYVIHELAKLKKKNFVLRSGIFWRVSHLDRKKNNIAVPNAMSVTMFIRQVSSYTSAKLHLTRFNSR